MRQLLLAMALMLGFAVTTGAQDHPAKMIVLLNKASWCPVCKANGARVEKDVMPMLMDNKSVKTVVNDLSDDKTKAASKTVLDAAGVTAFAGEHTGTIYFIDAGTKKLISKISVAESTDKIKQAFMKALAGS